MNNYKIHLAHSTVIKLFKSRGLNFKNTIGTPCCGNINSFNQNITFNEKEVTCEKCLNKLNN